MSVFVFGQLIFFQNFKPGKVQSFVGFSFGQLSISVSNELAGCCLLSIALGKGACHSSKIVN